MTEAAIGNAPLRLNLDRLVRGFPYTVVLTWGDPPEWGDLTANIFAADGKTVVASLDPAVDGAVQTVPLTADQTTALLDGIYTWGLASSTIGPLVAGYIVPSDFGLSGEDSPSRSETLQFNQTTVTIVGSFPTVTIEGGGVAVNLVGLIVLVADPSTPTTTALTVLHKDGSTEALDSSDLPEGTTIFDASDDQNFVYTINDLGYPTNGTTAVPGLYTSTADGLAEVVADEAGCTGVTRLVYEANESVPVSGGSGPLDSVVITGTGVVPTFGDDYLTEVFTEEIGAITLSEFSGASTKELSGPAVLKSSNTFALDRLGYDIGDSGGKLVDGIWFQIAYGTVNFANGMGLFGSDGNPVAGSAHNLPGYWSGLNPGFLAFGEGTGAAASNRGYLKFATPTVIEAGDMQLVAYGIFGPDMTLSAQFQPFTTDDELIRDLTDIAGVTDPAPSQKGLYVGYATLGGLISGQEGRYDNDRTCRYLFPGGFDSSTFLAGAVADEDQPVDLFGNQATKGSYFGVLEETDTTSVMWFGRIDKDNGRWHNLCGSTGISDSVGPSTNRLCGGATLVWTDPNANPSDPSDRGVIFRFRTTSTNYGPKAAQDNLNANGTPGGRWIGRATNPLVISTDDPQPLGVADPGESGELADAGHVHPMPSAANVGADETGAAADAQAAAEAYADGLFAANDAMVFKGALDCSGSINYPAAQVGWLWKVAVAGKIGGSSGAVVEVGDTIICSTDNAGGTQASVGADFYVIQVNIDGAVTGPTSSVDSRLAAFNGTSGKLLKDGGVAVDADTALAANADSRLPTQKAVKGYVDTGLALKAALASPTFTGTVTVPTPSGSTDAATKGYVDTATGLLVPKSVVTTKGDLLVASASGTVTRLGVSATDGQHLQADSSQTTGLSYVDNPPVMIFSSGRYVATGIWNQSVGVTSLRYYYMPLYVNRKLTITDLAVQHAATLAGSGSVGHFAIYNDNGGLPGSLLLDAGTIDLTTAAGFKPVTAFSQSVMPGLYWVAFCAVITSGSPTFFSCGSPFMIVSDANSANGSMIQSGVTGGTPPNPAVPASGIITTLPIIYVKTS